MNSDRKTATIAGVLSIIGMAAGVLSVVPAVEGPDYLRNVSVHESQVLIGACFQFIMAPVYVGVAVSLYPILRRCNESLALGFIGFRIASGGFIILGAISLPLLLTLSHEFVGAGAPDSSCFQTLGGLLRTGRDLVNHVAMILALSLGDLMYYYTLHRARLVPRWISGWGLLGTTLAISASLLLMFRLIGVVSTLYLALNLPLALQQAVLAVWLLTKGFNPSAVASASAEQVVHR